MSCSDNIALVIIEVVVNLAIPQTSGFSSRTMILANLLSVGQILPDMQAVERWQAIEEIIAMLAIIMESCSTQSRNPSA